MGKFGSIPEVATGSSSLRSKYIGFVGLFLVKSGYLGSIYIKDFNKVINFCQVMAFYNVIIIHLV